MYTPWDKKLKKNGVTEYEDLYKTLTEETLDLAGAVKAVNDRWGNNRSNRAAELVIQRETGMSFGQHIIKARATVQEKMIEGDDGATRILDLERREKRVSGLQRDLDKKTLELLEAQDQEKRLLDTTKKIVEGFNLKPLASPPKAATSDKKTKESAVLLLSDLHAGEVVNLEDMGGLGEFNWSILESRLSYVIERSRKFLLENMAQHSFDVFHIQLLGDMISGRIHAELLESEEFTTIEYCLGLSHLLAQAILYLATAFPQVKITGVVGNHGRMTQKPSFKKGGVQNFDYLVYKIAEQLTCHQPNIEWTLPRSFFAITEINGWNCLAYHGDGIRQYLSMPWYGLSRACTDFTELLESTDQRFSYMFLGHFHKPGNISNINVETFLNGSLIGPNEFSIKAVRGGHKPRQWLLGVHGDMGVSWRLSLDLIQAKDAKTLFTYDPSLFKFNLTESWPLNRSTIARVSFAIPEDLIA